MSTAWQVPQLTSNTVLQQLLKEYVDHYHHERPHQGQGNVLLFPGPSQRSQGEGPIRCRERLGGLLKYYDRAAA
jgi:putative transposase